MEMQTSTCKRCVIYMSVAQADRKKQVLITFTIDIITIHNVRHLYVGSYLNLGVAGMAFRNNIYPWYANSPCMPIIPVNKMAET